MSDDYLPRLDASIGVNLDAPTVGDVVQIATVDDDGNVTYSHAPLPAQSGSGLADTGSSATPFVIGAGNEGSGRWSGAHVHFLSWTPEVSGNVFLEPLSPPSSFAFWQVWAGDTVDVDYPGITGGAVSHQPRATSGAYLGVRAGQPHTIILSSYGADDAASIDLDPIFRSLQALGGVDPLVPYPASGIVRQTPAGLILAPDSIVRSALVTFSVHGQGAGGTNPPTLHVPVADFGPTGTGHFYLPFMSSMSAGQHMGPNYNFAISPPEGKKVSVDNAEFTMLKLDGSAALSLTPNWSGSLDLVEDGASYNFDFLNWASPAEQVGTDLVPSAADGWVVTTAGGVFWGYLTVDCSLYDV